MVKVKVRNDPADQQNILEAYLNELVMVGFLKIYLIESWQAAPPLVQKDVKTKYRTTINLQMVNAVTKIEQRPMPIIEAERSDFEKRSHFASLDFCLSYWQCPLDPQSWEACGVIASQSTFVSTRVLHGLGNVLAYFQSTTVPFFKEIKHAIKA